ncbi:MAG: 16S rRNA (guanine(527)-N(7))-methyltransferase RsmG [Erysipelotrichaceae bacterium]|jgi:16S rRNA (guanine527-N7)-methyltransferase|nr:16S rRNA (guanine(527)-N(7))-methyltransferase RsmG [Erysipelotrichaceae bacterium]MCB9499978.1 16S rRNA (guanine(527)-N(7))-methyltransferase RsmG [Erysipelotrichaceae bacterium]
MITIEEIKSNEKLMQFKKMVLDENKKMNLTSIVDDEEFIEKHLFDSLAILDYFDYTNKKIMDLGTGGGFPGIPLAIMLPNTSFVLIDSTRKKCDFVESVAKTLGLINVKVICSRAEELGGLYRDFFDFTVSRAVSFLPALLELSIPFLRINGKMISYKSIKYKEEIKASESAFKTLNASLLEVKEFTLPLSKEKRFNIIVNKDKGTCGKFPRSFALIKKRPL